MEAGTERVVICGKEDKSAKATNKDEAQGEKKR
jgi:hypothetical protein